MPTTLHKKQANTLSRALLSIGLLSGTACVITVTVAPAEAVQVFSFEGVRTLDGDILKLELTTDDNIPDNLKVGIGGFQGWTITNVTGTYFDKADNGIYNVVALLPANSFTPPIPPIINASNSDNLYNPTLPGALTSGGGLSNGGFVFKTTNTEYNYQVFTNLDDGNYAGCGSGTCSRILPVPGPLHLLGLGAVLGYSRKLRQRMKTSK